jgi:hypothetical protein
MKRKHSGVALVEFALVLPVLLVLTFTVTEFGRAMYQYNILTKSVRDAARYLSIQTPGSAAAIAEARNLVVYGNIAGTGNPLTLGLTTSNVPDPTWQLTGSGPVIRTVTVQISGYNFRPLFRSVFGLTFANGNGDVPYNTISATMRSQL